MTNTFWKLMIHGLAILLMLSIPFESFSKPSNQDSEQKVVSTTLRFYSSDGLYGPAANFLVNSDFFSKMQNSLKADSFEIVDTENAFIEKLSMSTELADGARFNELLRCNLTICMGSFTYTSRDEIESVLSQFSSRSGMSIAIVVGFVEIDNKQVANVLFNYRGSTIIENDFVIK